MHRFIYKLKLQTMYCKNYTTIYVLRYTTSYNYKLELLLQYTETDISLSRVKNLTVSVYLFMRILNLTLGHVDL